MSHISRSTLIIAFFFGVDKVFALLRQILMGRSYETFELDVFLAANNIPDLLSVLISGGALGVALIPVLSEYMERQGPGSAWELFSRIINLAFIATAVLSLLIAVVAEPIIGRLIVPGFPEAQKALAVELMRLDLLAIIIFSLSGLVMAGLQANQHFTLPAMAPVLYNLGQIVGILVFSPQEGLQLGPLTLPALGLGIHGLVFGVIFGAGLHLLIQVPGLVRYGYRWAPRIGLRDPGVAKVMRLLGPRVLTMACIQWFFLLRDNLASRMGEGAVTGLNYGWFIMQVPETLIGTALAIAILPTLAEHYARGDDSAFVQTLNRGIRAMLALSLPAAAILAIGVRPLVGVLGLEPAVSEIAIWTTRAYLLGLAGHALLEIAARSFYARQDALIPLVMAFLNAVLLYTVLALLFSSLWGIAGISLANSVAFTVEALLLFYLLNRRLGGVGQVRAVIGRIAAAALAGGALVAAVQFLLPFGSWGVGRSVLVGTAALAAGGLLAVPFIWREIRALVRI